MRFAVTNTRSLRPKLTSAVDCINEHDLSFMIVSETWLTQSPDLDIMTNDLKHRDGLEILVKSRKKKINSNRNPGGGLAIIFRKSLITLLPIRVKTNGFEIIAARGRIPNNSRPVFILGVYLPPSLPANDSMLALDTISDIVAKIKQDNKSPLVVIGGDFNNFDICDSVSDYNDIEKILSPPTRGNATLDVVATNFEVDDIRTAPPLCNQAGTLSDHAVLVVEVFAPHLHVYEWIKFRTRTITPGASDAFTSAFAAVDWESEIGDMTDPSMMTERLHSITERLNDTHFPWREVRFKSTDKPWITEQVKRKIRQRKRAYKKKADKSTRWRKLKAETKTLIAKNKKIHYEKAASKLKEEGAGKIPYRILNDISIPERPPTWTINMVAPKMSDADLAESLADYFTQITNEFEPLDLQSLPQTYPNQFQLMQPQDLAVKIRAMKKPKSAVAGDPLPSTVNAIADRLAIPATRIINHALQYKTWPLPWKIETQTGIPKGTDCHSYDQLRNLSCTNLLSKALESVVLTQLQNEVPISGNQYGGVCGSGTNHFLIETWNRILNALDSGRSAVSLMSIDFSKAFNRLDHNVCVRALARRGASTDTIAMVGAFLDRRLMNFKVNSARSSLRPVNGGSPQGTKLGNFLFIITIEDIEAERAFGDLPPPPQINEPFRDNLAPHDEHDQDDCFGLRHLAGRINAVRRFDSGVRVASTPVKAGTTDGVLRYFDRSGRENTPIDLQHDEIDAPWKEEEWLDKYVDDVEYGEKHFIDKCISTFTSSKEARLIHAAGCQSMFRRIETNAGHIGMRVNSSKTQLLCISPSINYEISSYFRPSDDSEEIVSQDTLKVLGFAFGRKPTVECHVKLIQSKFAARYWMIFHLKQNGVPQPDLVAIYSSIIRSTIEYAVPVYHHLLTAEQAEKIERLQKKVLRTIYGYDLSYAQALEKAGIKSLADRRREIVEKFTIKTASNPRYDKWFPLREDITYNLRSIPTYRIDKTNTERLKKNPVNRMRELLNYKRK